MVIILLSYFFILYITLGMGVIFNNWIKLENYNLLFTVLTGIFVQLILSTFYAVFFPLDHLFFLISLIISTLFIVFHLSTVKRIIQQSIQSFKNFSRNSKLLFLATIVLSLLHSSSLPFLTDNETYYIQTIKWLNNYGLVKGVANLHPFLGQFSGWHILQASFNFSFLTDNLNDINGFLIIISGYFMIGKWEAYKLTENKNDLFIALVFITMVGLFLFIGSPSPDLPILVVVPIIIYLFLELFQNNKNENINLITLLTLLLILIKVTIAPILTLLIIVLIKAKDFKHRKIAVILSLVSLSVFIIKNITISGHPLYPITFENDLITVDWKLNHNLYPLFGQFSEGQINNWEEFNKLNFIDKFWTWINLPKLNGILNKSILLFILIFPFFIRRKKEVFFLYAYFLVQFIIFYATSPQYRFFTPVLLAMGLFIGSRLFHKKFFAIKLLVIANLTILLFIGILGLKTDRFTNSDIMRKKYALIPSQIVLPRANTQFENLEFTEYQLENLNYFSPSKDSIFFWQTSNGPLPCMNKAMIDYFSKYYNHIPQMRTNNIKDGFLSAKPKK